MHLRPSYILEYTQLQFQHPSYSYLQYVPIYRVASYRIAYIQVIITFYRGGQLPHMCIYQCVKSQGYKMSTILVESLCPAPRPIYACINACLCHLRCSYIYSYIASYNSFQYQPVVSLDNSYTNYVVTNWNEI